MNILPEYVKLWKRYSEKGVVPIAKALAWLEKQAVNLRFDPEVAGQAMFIMMGELAKGRRFSIEGCDCGCELKDPHTAALHHARDIMLEIGAKLEKNRSAAVNEVWRSAVLAHIAESNRQDTEQLVPMEVPAGKLRRFIRWLTKPRLIPKYWKYK